MGHASSVKSTILFADNVFDMRSLDAYLQALDIMVQNALSPRA
jgi:hypothetical protein